MNKLKVKRGDMLVSQTEKSSFLSANNEEFQRINLEDGKSINSGYGTTAFQPESDSAAENHNVNSHYVSSALF